MISAMLGSASPGSHQMWEGALGFFSSFLGSANRNTSAHNAGKKMGQCKAVHACDADFKAAIDRTCVGGPLPGCGAVRRGLYRAEAWSTLCALAPCTSLSRPLSLPSLWPNLRTWGPRWQLMH